MNSINENISDLFNFFSEKRNKIAEDIKNTFKTKIKIDLLFNNIKDFITKTDDIILAKIVDIKNYLDSSLPSQQRNVIMQYGKENIKELNFLDKYKSKNMINDDMIVAKIEKDIPLEKLNAIVDKCWDPTIEKMLSDINNLSESDSILKLIELNKYLDKKIDKNTKKVLVDIGLKYIK